MSRSIIRWRRRRRRTSATLVIIIDLIAFCAVLALAAIALYVGTPAAIVAPFLAGVTYTALRAAACITAPLRTPHAGPRPADGV